MADAISQLFSKSSSRETKVNDQNKAGVDTAIVHTNTAKTQSEMVSHIATTMRYCSDICKKSREIAKAQQEVKLSKNNLTYDSKLIEIQCYARKDVVIPI